MNFSPELAEKAMAGTKTVTRRLASDNPRSPWWIEQCSLEPGRTYAVCPGRGKPAIGRIRVLRVMSEPLGQVDDREAKREGFSNWEQFHIAWSVINGGYDPDAIVWRVEFEVVDQSWRQRSNHAAHAATAAALSKEQG